MQGSLGTDQVVGLSGGELAAANAAFVMTFEIANLLGPPAAGSAMDAWQPHGLMVWMTAIAALFVVLATLRGLRTST